MSEDGLELGCKISLISKAGIRYEGRLFTVDPDQCTIALSGVRSFGTEERDVPQKVPPQNNVYDYILFRGTDIRDITIVSNPPAYPNDPAIMQLTLQPKPYQQHGGAPPHQQFGPMGPPPPIGQFPPAGYGGMMMGGIPAGIGGREQPPRGFPNPSELTMAGQPPPMPIIPPPDIDAVAAAAQATVVEQARPDGHDMFTGRSRSTTPASLISGKSSTAEQGVQASGPFSKHGEEKKFVQPIQPPGQRGRQQQQQQQQHRERRDSRGESSQSQQRNQQKQPNRYPGSQQNHPQQHQQPLHHQQQQQQHNQQQRQGGWMQRGPQRPRGPRGRNPGYKNTNIQQQDAAASAKPKIKFDQEYDFEQANSEFENLKSQLAKVKLEDSKTTGTTTTTTTGAEVNGDSDKKDDSGNETGAGEGEQEEEPEVYYDKNKSFFDNISCEAVERSKGRSQRTDWRTERKLNSETFGVAATRRGNNYRGRGAYRPMNYRGNNYRRGYQNQNQNQNQRPNLSNQQQNMNSTQSSTSGLSKPQSLSQPVAVNSAVKK